MTYTVAEVPNKTRRPEPKSNGNRLPVGAVLKPPVSLEDLRTGIEHDPEGAEEFVALIRAIREGRVLSGKLLLI